MAAPKGKVTQPNEVPASNRPGSTTAFQQAGVYANQGGYDPTAEGSFELKSKLYSDPAAYSFAINSWVSGWRNSTNVPNKNFKNELDYIQYLLRASGLSTEKGGVSRGVLTIKDLDGLKKASTIALANGVGFKDVMLDIYQSRQAAGVGADGPKYSKQVSTALRLIDFGDAKSKLSNAYFNMFGVYPNEENIKAFENYWNAQVKLQEPKTVTSQVSQKGKVAVGKQTGTGTVSTTQTTTTGEGFTDAEQAQAMADYLGKQFNMQNLGGGAVKRVYDSIREIYRNNFLPEPTYQSVAGAIKDLLTTPDEATYTTKLATLQQGVRDKAIKFYPALAEDLRNGKNVSDTADVYRSLLARKWGMATEESLMNDAEANSLIQSALNFKDEKGNTRLMDINEFLVSAQQSKKFLTSTQFIAGVGNLGDKIIAAMGGGRRSFGR